MVYHYLYNIEIVPLPYNKKRKKTNVTFLKTDFSHSMAPRIVSVFLYCDYLSDKILL